MFPDTLCLQYLENTTFIRNHSFDKFLERNNNIIALINHMCYTVGIVENKKIVHAFRFLCESPNSKIKSYKIEWWNTAAFERFDLRDNYTKVEFWIHSGMTLRKNFFLLEDRLSLFRSTFIYDPFNGTYYRLINIIAYCQIPEVTNYQEKIYTSPSKFYFSQKMVRKCKQKDSSHLVNELKKSISKIRENRQQMILLESVSPQLFAEINKFCT